MRIVLVAAVVLLCCGCLESRHPLGSAPPDRSLAGLWLSQEDWNNNVYLHVMLDPNDETMSLVRVNEPVTRQGGLASAEQYRLLLTRIGSTGYASLEYPPDKGYILLRYEVAGNRLRFWFMNYQPLAHAIAAGRLHGSAWTTSREDHVLLEDSTQDLRKFVESAGPELWSEPQEFHRLEVPAPR